jgi:hypothetical protein
MNPVLSSDEINFLGWAFAKNHQFSEWYTDRSRVPLSIWLNYADVLKNIDSFSIQNIQKKLAQVGHPDHLSSILSELKAAKVFAARDFEVELLLNDDQRFKNPPDLLVSRGEFQLLVEVQRKLGDHDIKLDLHRELLPLLDERNLVLSILYSVDLSKLAVDCSDRDVKYKKIQNFSKKLRSCLELLNHNQLPCSFDLDGSKISITAAEPGWGRISWATSATIVPGEKFVEQIKIAVQKKASKRNSWQGDYLALPFLIFLDLETYNLSEAIFSALYGSITLIDWLEPNDFGPQMTIYPQFVMDKLQGNQQELLFKLGFDSRRCFHINKPGIFVTEERVKRNTSGVVTMFNDTVECLPNPFCDEVIWLSALPEFLDIPLTSFAIGGSGEST